MRIKYASKTTIFWTILVAFAILRLWHTIYIRAPDIGTCLNRDIQGYGTVISEPESKDKGQVLVIHAENVITADLGALGDNVVAGRESGGIVGNHANCADNINIRVKTKLYPKYAFGSAVTFYGKLLKPYDFSSDDGRKFDYSGYLAKDDIFYEIRSAIIDEAKVADAGGETGFVDSMTLYLYKVKNRFVANLNAVLGEPHAALAAGLVVGEKSALGAQLLDQFRVVGLIHIVVLSGFNITVVGEALMKLLSRLPRVWGIFCGAIGIVLFGVMVGGGATVVRSCVMACIALLANLIRRDYNVARALAFAGLLMIIADPLILFHDPSFQLSFLATVGLVALASPIERRLSFLPEKVGIRSTVAATFATQAFVAPYILYMMGQLSIVGVIVNIIVLPFIPLTMLSVFLAGMFGFVFMPLSVLFGWTSHILLAYELAIVRFFAGLPFAALNVKAFSMWWVVGFYGVLVGGFVMVRLAKTKISKRI